MRKVMRKLTLTAALALGLATTGASAGNLDNPYARPPLIEPQCMNLGFIPCHTVFDYREPESNDTPRTRTPNDPDIPAPPRCNGPKTDRKGKGKSKGNASARKGTVK